jgi:predicted transcriptional regulator
MELDIFLMCACLAGEGRIITIKEVAHRWGLVPQTVWNNVQLLVDRNLIVKISHGKYELNNESFLVLDILANLKKNNGLEDTVS